MGRGLHRASYEVGEKEMFTEEVAKVLGGPFEVIPFKAPPGAAGAPRPKRHHVHAVPEKAMYEIRYPRVEGYTRAIRNRVAVQWSRVPSLTLGSQAFVFQSFSNRGVGPNTTEVSGSTWQAPPAPPLRPASAGRLPSVAWKTEQRTIEPLSVWFLF